MLEVCPTYTDT